MMESKASDRRMKPDALHCHAPDLPPLRTYRRSRVLSFSTSVAKGAAAVSAGLGAASAPGERCPRLVTHWEQQAFASPRETGRSPARRRVWSMDGATRPPDAVAAIVAVGSVQKRASSAAWNPT